ncbi:hypothetical protein [Streptomyces humidus]|uniref:hypothetical protein n=1 Tax=Streptomyces humidus TaxID=52259 RepID=UPI00167DC720|nr:hypothetical protein [Streptomyces humidus]
MNTVTRRLALTVLGAARFLMVLDTSVMNVSISQLVADFDTEVTAIQDVVTLYALVMAAFGLLCVGAARRSQSGDPGRGRDRSHRLSGHGWPADREGREAGPVRSRRADRSVPVP